MTLQLKFKPRSADERRASQFEQVVRAVHAPLSAVAEEREVPEVTVTVVFADDFVRTTDTLLAEAAAARGEEHRPYTTERVGGEAVAKNIPSGSDASAVTIVFNANMHAFGEPAHDAMSLFLAAHELSHPVIERLRAASGALVGVRFPRRPPPSTPAASCAAPSTSTGATGSRTRCSAPCAPRRPTG